MQRFPVGWLLGCLLALLMPAMAHADLSQLIKELQQCQQNGRLLKQCRQGNQALAKRLRQRIARLEKTINKQEKTIIKLSKRLGIKPPTPRNVLSGELAKHPALLAKRTFAKVNADDASFGPTDAAVTIVEFSDFQCPYCTRGAKVVDQIKKAYKGKVRIVFKHLPLPFHKQAHIAAQAALAAKAQGKFWQYHDKLFANSRNINKANLIKWAKELGLDATKVKDALDKGTYKAQVDRDLQYAGTVGARGTPNFLVNGRRVAGAYPFSHFKRIIDQELDFAKKAQAKGVASGDLQKLLMKAAAKAAEARLRLLKNMPMDGSPQDGPKNAKVRIYEFSDFQCPFCQRGSKVVAQIKKAYGNKVLVVFKHNPLSFHKQAHIAAQASMEAHAQGKFWQYHDKLFENYRNINKENLIKWAKEVGLDTTKMKAALDSGKYKAIVDRDLALGQQVGVRGTPNFFVNGVKVAGAYPFSHFKKIIDGQLQKAGETVPAAPRVAPQPRPRKRAAAAPAPVPAGAPSMGPKDAKVTIVEYSDFQCPFCNRGANTIKQLVKDYKGKIRVVFRHRPLSFHPQAHIAAQASMAAHAQGKFWPYHDKLFANGRNINKANLLKWAKELGLDVNKFHTALDKGTYKAYVDKDNKEAVRVGAAGTPTFFINGQKLVGAQPIARFKSVIDGFLSGKVKPRAAAPAPRAAAPQADGNAAAKALRTFVKINADDASFGPKDAAVTIVEFSDFQCPFCTRGAKTVEQIKKAYKGKVRVVFKHLPLPFHSQAHIAAQAALAAKAQGKFWQFHDKLFENGRSINKANLIKWAKELGLDATKVKDALDKGTYKAQVDRDLQYAGTVGARGTPNFFVNGRKVAGAYPFSHFKKIIDQELAYTGKLMKQGTPQAKLYDKLMEAGKKAADAERIRKQRAAEKQRKALAGIDFSKSPSFGPADAKVTIIEFSDFQCPFCSRAAKTIDQIKKAYKGKVRIVYKHLPLGFHKQAHIAAQASMAAKAQGKFWQFHDKLFANYRNLSKENFVKWAKELGLNTTTFQKALDNGTYKKAVDADAALARRLGVGGTPSFFINGQKLVGAQPFSRFKAVIDQQLAQ